ncbi:MAG: hypothetical protein MK212_20630 [Saprospiraceae bacterium]|nr:hypothetical protein [Saprospiraceae bacterium]
MNYLTVENLSKNYGDRVLFENITFYINQGDKVAFIAKNGSKKSFRSTLSQVWKL